MQHERDPLGRRQRFKHHEQRETNRVGQQRLLLRIDLALVAHNWVGHVHGQRLFAPRLARAQHIEAHPRYHRRQPSAQVLNLACVGTAKAQPALLHGVVGLFEPAKHAIGHRPQVGTLGLEALRQPLAPLIDILFPFGQSNYSFIELEAMIRSHFLVTFRHCSDERNSLSVTKRLKTYKGETSWKHA